MCVFTRGPCRLVEYERGWPEFLKCHEEYPKKCKVRLSFEYIINFNSRNLW